MSVLIVVVPLLLIGVVFGLVILWARYIAGGKKAPMPYIPPLPPGQNGPYAPPPGPSGAHAAAPPHGPQPGHYGTQAAAPPHGPQPGPHGAQGAPSPYPPQDYGPPSGQEPGQGPWRPPQP